MLRPPGERPVVLVAMLRLTLVSCIVAMGTLFSPASAAVAVPSSAGSFSETELWDATDTNDPYVRMHVQAFAVVPAGTPLPASGGQEALAGDVVLAVTEGRKSDCDCAKKDLLLRRSLDGARTWSASVVVVTDDAPEGDSIGSPSLLVDGQMGAVFLFYRGANASTFVKRSDDAGATWGARVNLSSLYATNPNGWTSQAPTPGHGIQLVNGRLLMPVSHKASGSEPRYGVDLLLSDDHGVSWRRSAPIPFSTSYPIGESRVFQRSDGAVVINGRWGAGGTHYRITSTSTDGGATWSPPVVDDSVEQFVAVDAGLIRYTRGPVNRILYSRPDSAARENMTVSVSYDEGASYRYSRVVNPGPSYYSDLASLSDGTILLIYGRDGESRAFPERIAVARFDLEWLTNGRDSLASGPGFVQLEYELAIPQARTNTGGAPHLVSDANAGGGKVIRHGANGLGDYVEVPFDVTTAGSYEMSVRQHRRSDRGRIRTSVDGTDLPYSRVDPTMTTGEGFRLYPLGVVTLAAGVHWIRFTLVDVGRGGGKVIAPDQLMLISGGPAADPLRTVADNNAPAGFEIVSGTWDTDATGVAGYYGQFYATHPAGTGGAVARFRPDVRMTGTYEVAVWYPAHSNRASNAPYVVKHADGQATFRVDQRTEGGRWVVLGAFSFVAGDTATVELSDDADGYVVADAVRLVRLGGVADNSATGFEMVSGSWNPATGVSGYYGQDYRTAPAGTGASKVRWRPDVPASGVYQVAVWYTADGNRASNAPYVVNHAGGSTTIRIDQRTRGSQWVSLGYFLFAVGTGTVELSDDADGYVIADAVRLIYQGVVADNASTSFSVVTGTWNTNAQSVPGYYERNYATSPAGTGAAKARWTLAVPTSGVYQVAVWYTADGNRASNAPYVVNHAGGSTTVRVDQRSRNGRWVSLGEYSFAAGVATVELADDANGYVIADAVRILYQRSANASNSDIHS
ncbi:exo-alpha-sialidase [Nonomuraea wenchangensis]|uniref:golvesin C-terminal-like domain-containing protein n=1 Tax=Nonomuraea wenchangensis TaxID=568860 RepID=UPI00384EC386